MGWCRDSRHADLSRFDYLSTVSGGGYTGAMLTAWVQRAGYDNVEKELVDGPQSNATISVMHFRSFELNAAPSVLASQCEVVALHVLCALGLFALRRC